MNFVLKSCCNQPAAPGWVFESTTDTVVSPFTGNRVETSITPPEPTMEVAVHESAHAMVHHLYGTAIEYVRVIDPAQCAHRPRTKPLTPQQHIVLKLAGLVAEDRLEGVVRRSTGFHLRRYFEKIRSLHLGSCDTCQAVTCALTTVGAEAGNGKAYRFYRRAEDAAITMMAEPTIWAAVTALAEQLLADGTVGGSAAHQILSQHISYGSYAEQEHND